MLSVEKKKKKKEADSAHKYQTWQHKAVSACAGLHMGASAWVEAGLCQLLFPTWGVGGAAFLLQIVILIKACGEKKSHILYFLLLHSPIWTDFSEG